jgi:hypothetical protein
MSFCSFDDASLQGLIQHNGKADLAYLSFASPRQLTLSAGLQAVCDGCVFGSHAYARNCDWASIRATLSWSGVAAVAVFLMRRRVLTACKFLFEKKNT